MSKRTTSKFQSYKQFFESATPEETKIFEQIIQDGCDAVDELWKTGKFYSVIFRCGMIDYRYEWAGYDNKGEELVRHPSIGLLAMDDGLKRLSMFIIDNEGKKYYGDKATLLLFRVSEHGDSPKRGNDTPNQYKFEYDWNPATKEIELIEHFSGQQFDGSDSTYPQLNQEAGKIAAVIYDHICKPERFKSARGTSLGRDLGINL